MGLHKKMITLWQICFSIHVTERREAKMWSHTVFLVSKLIGEYRFHWDDGRCSDLFWANAAGDQIIISPSPYIQGLYYKKRLTV